MPARLRALTPEASPWHQFGAKLRERRLECEWPQQELGRRVATTKSHISLLETASRRARRDLARRLDVALAASGEILALLPGLVTEKDEHASGVVTVGYAGAGGPIGLCTAELALIGLCDELLTRSCERTLSWTVQAARSIRWRALPTGQAMIELDAPRSTTRVWAATNDALYRATYQLVATMSGGTNPADVATDASSARPLRNAHEPARNDRRLTASPETDESLARQKRWPTTANPKRPGTI